MSKLKTRVVLLAFLLTVSFLALAPTVQATYTPVSASDWSDLMSLCAEWVQWNTENPSTPDIAHAWTQVTGTSTTFSSSASLAAGAYCVVTDANLGTTNGPVAAIGSPVKYANLCSTTTPNLIPGCVTTAPGHRTTASSAMYAEIVEYSSTTVYSTFPTGTTCGFNPTTDFVITPNYLQVGPGGGAGCTTSGHANGYTARGVWDYPTIRKISQSLAFAKLPARNTWEIVCGALDADTLAHTFTIGQGAASGTVYIGAGIATTTTKLPKVVVTGGYSYTLTPASSSDVALEFGNLIATAYSNLNVNYVLWKLAYFTSGVNDTSTASLTATVSSYTTAVGAAERACFISPHTDAGNAANRYVDAFTFSVGTTTTGGLFQTWDAGSSFHTTLVVHPLNDIDGIVVGAYGPGITPVTCTTSSTYAVPHGCSEGTITGSQPIIDVSQAGFTHYNAQANCPVETNGGTCTVEFTLVSSTGETVTPESIVTITPQNLVIKVPATANFTLSRFTTTLYYYAVFQITASGGVIELGGTQLWDVTQPSTIHYNYPSVYPSTDYNSGAYRLVVTNTTGSVVGDSEFSICTRASTGVQGTSGCPSLIAPNAGQNSTIGQTILQSIQSVIATNHAADQVQAQQDTTDLVLAFTDFMLNTKVFIPNIFWFIIMALLVAFYINVGGG